MKILLRQVQITDPASPFNGQVQDIFIEDGIIRRIGSTIRAQSDQEIVQNGLHVSPGWVDVFAHFCDPGYEFKETLQTGAACAAAGGYTDVLVIPNTRPVIDNKGQTEYIIQKSKSLPVTIHPIGAITKNTDGKELAEMYDMHASGIFSFSDGLNPIQSPGVLLKALQYVKAFDGTIIQLPDDKSINPHGLMNEGIVSTRMGLSGKPAMAEELMVARDIKLARYSESSLHFTGISSAKSLEYIQRGKEGGVRITCSVTPHHLVFTEDDLNTYDTNLKVNPPFRTDRDRQALIDAVRNGTADCIASHHAPQDIDSKMSEFEYAKYGMTGLETAYAILNSIAGLSQDKIVSLLSVNPRKIFRIDEATIKEDQKASLTLFDPKKKWTFTESETKSRSKNSPFFGKEFSGRPVGIIHKNQTTLN